MVSALFLLFEVHKQWKSGNWNSLITKGDLCLCAAAIWLLFVSKSATSLLAFSFGAVTYWTLGLRAARRARTSWVFMLILVVTIAIPLGFSGAGMAGTDTGLGSVVDLTGHGETFWGRTILWKEVIDRVPNPLLGCGYESFWLGERLEELWALYWWQPNEAHNGFVGVYATLGLAGLAILIGIIVQSYRRLYRLFAQDNESEYARIGLACLTAALFYNVTEYAFLGMAPIWFIILLVSIRLSSTPAEASDALQFSASPSECISA
jgi:O-antigen ligase